MQIRDINLKELTASEGMILTDGKDFARQTRLAEDVDPSTWYEIPEAEYEQIMTEKEAQNKI